MAKSIETEIRDKGNGWLKSYGLHYVQESGDLQREIDNALSSYYSKTGGKGGNRPDSKLLLKIKIMIAFLF